MNPKDGGFEGIRDNIHAHYEDEAFRARAALKLQQLQMICNQCSHRWQLLVADHPVTVISVHCPCPECGSDDTINEADLISDQADARV